MGNAPFVPRGKQGRALCFRLKQANTSRLSKKPQNRLEQKTSGRYKLVVQEGQAPRMGIIGNTLIESPRTPFSANTLLWTPFGATQTNHEVQGFFNPWTSSFLPNILLFMGNAILC